MTHMRSFGHRAGEARLGAVCPKVMLFSHLNATSVSQEAVGQGVLLSTLMNEGVPSSGRE